MSNDNQLEAKNKINLPNLKSDILPYLDTITSIMGVPRTILASKDEILYAWNDLPRELTKIPPDLRDEFIVKMCVAISSGLFDGALNYMWNASINNLRKKIRFFGLNVIAKIKSTDFDEYSLLDLRDSELLTLCLSLNIISEDGYFFLDQCRDIRNNYSAAHPSSNSIDDRELINFISRCQKYALADSKNLKGVDIEQFLLIIKDKEFNKEQTKSWVKSISETHEAQRNSIFIMLHGIYCDPSSNQQARINSISICKKFSNKFSPNVISGILNDYQGYQNRGDEKRHKASMRFFELTDMFQHLHSADKHHIISKSCSNLLDVHLSFNNFYNEPPFAERLYELSKKHEIPESAKNEFVVTITECIIGNRYGVSRAALPYYEDTIKNFTPIEINIFLNIPFGNTNLSRKLKSAGFMQNFKDAVSLVNNNSLSQSQIELYNKVLSF